MGTETTIPTAEASYTAAKGWFLPTSLWGSARGGEAISTPFVPGGVAGTLIVVGGVYLMYGRHVTAQEKEYEALSNIKCPEGTSPKIDLYNKVSSCEILSYKEYVDTAQSGSALEETVGTVSMTGTQTDSTHSTTDSTDWY